MFWCIPGSLFHTRSLRRSKSSSTTPPGRKPISGPVGLDDQPRRMHFQRHHPEAAASEPGLYYLVPNKHGPGKSIVRRTPLPPPPPPLDDEFDNATQAATTMAQKADTDWAGRTRGSPMTGVSMPLDDNFDAATYTGPGGDSNTDSAWRTPSNQTRDRAPARTPMNSRDRYFTPRAATNNSPSPGSGSKTANDPLDNYGDYGLYMREMERVFDVQEEVEAAVQKKDVGMDRTEHKLGRIKSREAARNSPLTRSPDPGHPTAYHPRFDTGAHYGHNYGVRSRKKGPRAGQDYEVVSRKVVEDTPEKTVTIATWRERVAREADPNAMEQTSVSYVGPEDYAAGDRTMTEVDSNVQSVQRTLHETGKSDSIRSARPVEEPSKEVMEPVIAISEEPSPIESYPRPPTPPQKSSSNLHQARSTSSHSHPRSIPPRILAPERTPTPKNNPRSPRAATRRNIQGFHEHPLPPEPPKSPPPGHNAGNNAFAYNVQPPSPTSSRHAFVHNLQSPLQESTPIRASMSPIPFRPRQSQGSTISSIKSESFARFEQILGSCEPSLLHIAPVLARLGITKEEHLKAVTRLSEEMRDREVREEALRMGVTVVEWAILLDKVGKL